MKTVKERSKFTVTNRIRLGTAPTAPNTLHYRIDCRTTKREIVPWTEIPSSSTVPIVILPAWNAILNSANLVEQKSITFSANKDTSDEVNDAFTWEVKNLQGVL